MRRIQHLLFLLTVTLISGSLYGQAQSTLDQALRHIEDNQATWGLNKADISDLKISDHVFSKFGEVDHFYFIQRHNGIEVYNAITSVSINPSGKVFAPRHNFIPNLASKINTTSNKIDEADAVKNVFRDLEIDAPNFNYAPIERANGKTTFAKGTVSNVDINVQAVYQLMDNEVRLAWDVTLDPKKSADYWNIRVDALDGHILDKTNYTLYCQFDNTAKAEHSHTCTDHNHDTPLVKTTTKSSESIDAVAMGGSYNVFAEVVNGVISPFESPSHGPRNTISDPADLVASPFGWHDVNGVEGADFTITRGNNVYAYLDVNDDDTPDAGSDIEGGEELIFDFPWTDDTDPENSEGAAVTNLFFMSNFLHDFAYAHGFDESAGNFQQNNYGNADSGAFDPLQAQAQDGRDLFYADPVNDTHVNNANMATPADGGSPRMQMFIWSRAGGKLLDVNSPSNIARKYDTETAAFSPDPTLVPVIDGELALAFDDDIQTPSFGCGAIVNADEINGKVAVIDRGGCLFIDKALNAQNAGAIAMIVCNFEDPAIVMGGVLPELTIPAIMIGNTDCTTIKTVMANSPEPVIISIGADGNVGADFFDGDVDNGIIAHEFAHGISNRLVGGPTSAGCLGNSEQMGEGWSDFFTLITAVKEGEDGTERAGIGTYVGREPITGTGIRSFPYSTDLSIDPETYEDLPTAALPHGIGKIWSSMLWDTYWALVDEYGFDPDITNGTGGNNIAVRLVTEGMKFTACNPGFVDGRDGILAADQMLFDGDNQCIIWNAFARRGLGQDAVQGSSDDQGDGVADFNAPRGCVQEVKMTKTIVSTEDFPDVVDAGDEVNFLMTLINDKLEAVNEVTLTESIPAGHSVSNISNGGEVVGDNIVWELGTMEPLDEFAITYTLNVDPSLESQTFFVDDLESGAPNWIPTSDAQTNPDLTANPFTLGNNNAGLGTFSGNAAFFVVDPAIETRENIFLGREIAVSGENPGLRFFHNYDTEGGADGVLLQVSRDGATTFQDVETEQFIKNEYPRGLQFGTFVLPFLSAYSGNSGGWQDVWVDLNEYQGEVIFVRFRFGSDDNTEGVGYAMDNFEYLNVVRFNNTATLTTAEGDFLELTLPDGGIKIEPTGIDVAVDDVNNPSLGFNIYPNPASETVNLSINNIDAKNAQLSVFNYSGQLIAERNINLTPGAQAEQVNVANYPTGFYFFRLTTERGVATEKIMIEN